MKKDLRYEHKYLIDITKWHQLKALLMAQFKFDENADESGKYQVDSIYFDTDQGYYYDMKEAALSERHLLRVRQYAPHSPMLRFELKGKINDGVYKWSVWMTSDEYQQLLNNDYSFLLEKGEIGHFIYAELRLRQPLPKYLIRYTREVFDLPVYGVRISADTSIRAANSVNLDDASTIPLYEANIVILEVKGKRELPPYLTQLIASFSPLRVMNSKFERAVSSLP